MQSDPWDYCRQVGAERLHWNSHWYCPPCLAQPEGGGHGRQQVSSRVGKFWWPTPGLPGNELLSLHTTTFLLARGLAEAMGKLPAYVCMPATGLQSPREASWLFHCLLHCCSLKLELILCLICIRHSNVLIKLLKPQHL